MKKYLPFVFPAIALLIVLFLGYRWYSMRTDRTGVVSTFGEGVEIEDLTGSEQDSVLRGAGDYKTVTMTGQGEAAGSIRYEIKDGKVRFSVNADLAELSQGQYQVWLKAVGSDAKRKAFVLENNKAGFMGSAAIDATTLPFEVIVSKEVRPDDTIEEVVLQGTINKESN
ncbi:MAG TPA: hypothetical protein VD999_03185 [Vitreimonas sp.]|nr:hypothetical protein [Vitreimonas sp.]